MKMPLKDITNAFNAETRQRIFRWKAKDITAFRAKHNIDWRVRRHVVAQRHKVHSLKFKYVPLRTIVDMLDIPLLIC